MSHENTSGATSPPDEPVLSTPVLELIGALQVLADRLRLARAVRPEREGLVQFEIADDRRLDVQIHLSPREPARMRPGSHPFPDFAVRATMADFTSFLRQGSGTIVTRGDFGLWKETLRILRAPDDERREMMKGRPWVNR